MCCHTTPSDAWHACTQTAEAAGALDDAGAKFDLPELYAAMKHAITEPPAEPHPALKPTLRPYQLRAAKWMQCRGEPLSKREREKRHVWFELKLVKTRLKQAPMYTSFNV